MPKGKTPRKQRLVEVRKGKAAESPDIFDMPMAVVTPGWVSGSADLFKEPLRTPSPFKGRVMTRRSSMYVRSKVVKGVSSQASSSQQMQKVTKVTKSRSVTSATTSSQQNVKLEFSPVTTRAKRSSVYVAKQSIAAFENPPEVRTVNRGSKKAAAASTGVTTQTTAKRAIKAQTKKKSASSPKGKPPAKKRTPSPPRPRIAAKRSRLSEEKKALAVSATKVLSPRSTSRAKSVQVIVLRTPYKTITNRSPKSSPVRTRTKRSRAKSSPASGIKPVETVEERAGKLSQTKMVNSQTEAKAPSPKQAVNDQIIRKQSKAKTASPKNSEVKISTKKFYASSNIADRKTNLSPKSKKRILSSPVQSTVNDPKISKSFARRGKSKSPMRKKAKSPGGMEKTKSTRKRSPSKSPKRFQKNKKSTPIRTPKLSAIDMKRILESSEESDGDISNAEEAVTHDSTTIVTSQKLAKLNKSAKKQSAIQTPKRKSPKPTTESKKTSERAKLRSTPVRTESKSTPIQTKVDQLKKTPGQVSLKNTSGRKTPSSARLTRVSKSVKRTSMSATNVTDTETSVQVAKSGSTPNLARKIAVKSLMNSPKPNTPSSAYSTPKENLVSSQKSVRIAFISPRTPAKAIQRKATPGRAQATPSVRKVTPGRQVKTPAKSSTEESDVSTVTALASMSVKRQVAPVKVASTKSVTTVSKAMLEAAAAVGTASIGTPEKALRVLGKTRSTEIKTSATPVRTSTPRKGGKRLSAPPPVSEIRSKRLRSAVGKDEVDFTQEVRTTMSESIAEETEVSSANESEVMVVQKRPEHGWWWCSIM